MFVAFTWRGKYMNLQMFFPTLKTPTKKEITAAIQGVYPGAVCKHYYMTDRDPSKALLRLPEEKVEEGVGRAAIGAGVGAMVGGPIGAAAGAAIGASMGKKKVTGDVKKKKPVDIADPHGNVAKGKMKKNLKREDFLFIEKDLNAAERRALPDKDFALPGKGKGPQGKQAGSYPIPDKSHARMALAMVAKHGTPDEKSTVRAKVAKKFPDIQQEEVGISSGVAMLKAKKEAELRRKEELAKKKVKKEEVQVDEEKKALPKLKMYRKAGNLARAGDEKSMKRQTKMVSVLNKETSKGYKKAALDKLRSGGSPKHQVDEKFATQYKDKGKLSKTDAPGSRHDHTHDVDPRMADHVPNKKVRKSSKAETRANVLKFDMKKEEADLQKRIDRVNTDIASKPLENEKGKATTKDKQLARIKRQILLAKMRGLRKDPGASDSIAS